MVCAECMDIDNEYTAKEEEAQLGFHFFLGLIPAAPSRRPKNLKSHHTRIKALIKEKCGKNTETEGRGDGQKARNIRKKYLESDKKKVRMKPNKKHSRSTMHAQLSRFISIYFFNVFF